MLRSEFFLSAFFGAAQFRSCAVARRVKAVHPVVVGRDLSARLARPVLRVLFVWREVALHAISAAAVQLKISWRNKKKPTPS